MSLYRFKKNSWNLSTMKEVIAQGTHFLPIKWVTPAPIANSTMPRQELLEISDNISLYYAPKIAETSKKLTLLSIDPQNIYSYWNLLESQPGTLSHNLLNKELILKVFAKTKDNQQSKATPIVEIKISDLQAGRKIKLPKIESVISYSAIIGKAASNKTFVSLVHSNNMSTLQNKKVIDEFISNDLPMDNKKLMRQIETETRESLSVVTSKKSHFSSNNFSGQNNV